MMVYITLGLYLLYNSYTDYKTKYVYNFTHYILVTVFSVVLLTRDVPTRIILELFIYLAIQYFLFMKLYGRGDGIVFIVCALFFAINGKGMVTFLHHMLYTFLILGVVQGIKGNIAGNGELKKPVALVPYIAASFLMC